MVSKTMLQPRPRPYSSLGTAYYRCTALTGYLSLVTRKSPLFTFQCDGVGYRSINVPFCCGLTYVTITSIVTSLCDWYPVPTDTRRSPCFSSSHSNGTGYQLTRYTVLEILINPDAAAAAEGPQNEGWL